MPQDVKLWEIINKSTLKEIPKSKLEMESRLENWLEKDISIISDDLLVIGRQVVTDFGGIIDLLCLDYNGDIIIVELKRDKTPREVVAQVLDYASWTNDLSNQKITEIANEYLGDEVDSLEEAFRRKFDLEIPEILNERHKMYIVAAEIDSSSERIIKYLSASHGVGINAITFQFLQDEEAREFLARIFLIEPVEAEDKIPTITSKRKRSLSYEELQKIAEKKGVGEIYQRITEELPKFFNQSVKTKTGISFTGIMGERKSRQAIFSIVPQYSDSENGLSFRVYIDRLADYLGIEKKLAIEFLPSYKTIGVYQGQGEWGGGYFKEDTQVEKFLAKITEFRQRLVNFS